MRHVTELNSSLGKRTFLLFADEKHRYVMEEPHE
jgi:hypothetical protein